MASSPLSESRRPVVDTAIGAILAWVVLFWRLGDASFWDPDEAHYAETSRELLQTGDWLAPFYNGVPFFDKPIYFHWLQGGAMALFGATPFSARIGPALAGLALVAITAWVGSRLAGRRVARVAALLLVCNPGLFGLARYAILDAPFTACLFGGVAVLAVSAIEKRPRLEYAGYALLAAATCIKGPIAMVLAGLAFLIAIAWSRDVRRMLLGLHWIRGIVIVVIVSAPWLLYMLQRFGDAFVQGYFLNENLRLFSQPLYANQPGWWFYLSIITVGFLPWTGLWIGRAFDTVQRARSAASSVDAFDVLLWSWVITIVGFFSASAFKLDHYVFPAAPALCLLAARAWCDAHGERVSNAAGARLGVRIIGPVLIVAGVAIAILATRQLALPNAFLVVPALLIVLGSAEFIRTFRLRRAGVGAPSLALGAMAVLYAGVLIWVLPALEAGKVVPDLARYVRTHATAADRISTFRLSRWNPTYRFYVDRPVAMLDAEAEATAFFADAAPTYCVTTAPQIEALRQLGIELDVVYQREGLWASSGQALWRRRGDPTTFVVAVRAGRGAAQTPAR